MAEKDGNGNVALKHYNTNPKTIKIGSIVYSFVPHANICLAWVQEGHVDQVLAIKHKCGCASGGGFEFRYANESDVRRWTNRGGG